MSTVLELSKETLAILDSQELSPPLCGNCFTGLRPAPLQCMETEISTNANTSPRSDGLGSWSATPATPASPLYLFKSPPCLLDAIDRQKDPDNAILGAYCCRLNSLLPPPPGLEPPPGFGPPPGLTAVVMSKGSELHNRGQCRPCQWFHKPQGCRNGADCEHCHLCGKQERLAKRQAKRLTRRASGIPALDIDDPADEMLATAPSPQMHITPSETSVGSAMHGTGSCKPCAWFFKLGGCQYGLECRHCHLCPEGELRKRKKEKKGLIREPSSAVASSPASSASTVASPSLGADVLEKLPRRALALDALLPQASPKASGNTVQETLACPPGLLLPVSPTLFPSLAAPHMRGGRASPVLSLLDAIQAPDVQRTPSSQTMSMTQSSGMD